MAANRGAPAGGALRAVSVCAAVLALLPTIARSQSTPSETQTVPAVVTIEGGLTATDNGALSAAGSEKSDLRASVRPHIAMTRRGAGFELDLDAAATLRGYANGTQKDGIYPDARAALKAILVERWLYVNAEAQLRQTEANLFGSRVNDSSGANQRTERTFRLSPYVDREFASNAWVFLGHDAFTTTNGGGAGARLQSNRSVLRVEQLPVPLGAAGELVRFRSESQGASDSKFALDTARLRGSVVLDGQWVVGARAGVDQSEVLHQRHTDSLYGISLGWKPSLRTDLSANVEHRFFGLAGDLTLRHRTPLMSIALSVSRQPVLSSTSGGAFGQGPDLKALLDAILTTRYPDPTTRSGLVDSLLTSRGLQTQFSSPTNVVADYPQTQTYAGATWVLLGSRNTATFNAYVQTLRQLTRDGDPLAAPTSVDSDSREAGASFEFNRRLTPQLSADAIVRWTRITGLAANTGDVSQETTYRLSLMQALTARSWLSAGVQYIRFSTNVSGLNPYHATLAFVGLTHRF